MNHSIVKESKKQNVKVLHKKLANASEYSTKKGYVIPRKTFRRIVKCYFAKEGAESAHISLKAVNALQRFTENKVGGQINKAAFLAVHVAGKKTLTASHMDVIDAISPVFSS